jgi:hypothetical protein
MKTIFLALVFVAAAQFPAVAQDDDDVDMAAPEQPSCFGDKVRISALISAGDSVKVGLVETATKASYLVSPGERAGEVEVVAADYGKETVTLRLGEETCTLNLASDPNAGTYAAMMPSEEPVFRGEAIEKFLRENPDAMRQGMIKFPLPIMPAAVGKGESIERFLRENPDIAAKVDQPVVGKGDGIESYLKAHPDVKVVDEIPEGSFGPGIDAELQKHPELMTNTAPVIPESLRD